MNAGDAAVGCEAFAADAGELATGTLDGARSRALLAHAATCPSCRALLDATVAVVDELLLLAPSAEPPAGFEAGAVAALRREDEGVDGRRRRKPRRLTAVAAAAAAVVVFAAGAALGSRVDDDGDRDRGMRTTPIVAAAGDTPAAGFEAGAVAALRREDEGVDGRRRRKPRRLTAVAAAAAAVVVFAAGAALGSRVDDDGDRDRGMRTTPIVAAAGDTPGGVQRVGSVAAEGGRLVVRLAAGPDWPAEVTCELRPAAGRAGWVPVATWRLRPQRGGVWAVELEGDLAGAGEMRLVGAGGEVVGQAFLT